MPHEACLKPTAGLELHRFQLPPFCYSRDHRVSREARRRCCGTAVVGKAAGMIYGSGSGEDNRTSMCVADRREGGGNGGVEQANQ